MSEPSGRPPIVVVGGGISGLTAALRLSEQGFETHLIEAADRLGGKCGAVWDGRNFNEHAYHILPLWYVNFWALLADLGVAHRAIDLPVYSFLRAGEFPRMMSLENVGSYKYALRNLRAGVMSPAEMFLYMYSILDLTSTSFSRRAFLDNISVNGFMRSRWYATEHVAIQHQEILFKTFSVPAYKTSAMSYQALFKYWLGSPVPTMRMLRGNVHTELIEPLARRLQDKGGRIRLKTRLEGLETTGNRVTRLAVRDLETNQVRSIDVADVILAIPPERVGPLVNDRLYGLSSRLGEVQQLEANPIASLNIYFTRTLSAIPANVVSLLDSKYGLTLIDNSQLWGPSPRTFLNVVATKCRPLASLSEAMAQQEILADLRKFLPFADADVDYVHYQGHVEEPLFACGVGSWQHRPGPRSEVGGLYFSGDYCRSHVDVVCLESAVTTGLNAAAALLEDRGLRGRVTVRRPPVLSRALLLGAKYGLLPVALASYIWARLSGASRAA